MLTGLLMKNGRGFEFEIFGRVGLNIAGTANSKVLFYQASVKFRLAAFDRVCFTGV